MDFWGDPDDPIRGLVRDVPETRDSMTKLAGALVVLVLFLMIIGARTVFGSAKRSWQKANMLADRKAEGGANDPEFDEKHEHLDLFLHTQELLLSIGSNTPTFVNEREKLRYLHFVFGAIDQLSRTIEDEERAELWAMTTSMARAVLLFGLDDAMEHLKSYGRTGDAELHEAGGRGWQAMHTYILNSVGKASRDGFQKSCAELFTVVRGKEPQGV
jgi:hypothetical protein